MGPTTVPPKTRHESTHTGEEAVYLMSYQFPCLFLPPVTAHPIGILKLVVPEKPAVIPLKGRSNPAGSAPTPPQPRPIARHATHRTLHNNGHPHTIMLRTGIESPTAVHLTLATTRQAMAPRRTPNSTTARHALASLSVRNRQSAAGRHSGPLHFSSHTDVGTRPMRATEE